MRRLLTGYAVTFNQRHNRAGDLFQPDGSFPPEVSPSTEFDTSIIIGKFTSGANSIGEESGMVPLRVGSRGPEVARLQDLLSKHLQPYQGLKVDAIFGLRTEAAVKRYQSSVGIGVDCVAGVNTWETLERANQ